MSTQTSDAPTSIRTNGTIRGYYPPSMESTILAAMATAGVTEANIEGRGGFCYCRVATCHPHMEGPYVLRTGRINGAIIATIPYTFSHHACAVAE